MIYVFFIIIILFPILTKILNISFNKKMYVHNLLLICIFAPIFILVSPFTTSQIANRFYVLSISLIYFGSLLIFISILLIKNNDKIKNNFCSFFSSLDNKKTFYWWITSYITSFFVFIMILLFTKHNDHDATYYINISSNFSQGIYSLNGINDISIPPQYLLPSMYYVNGSLFSTNISQSYYLLTPSIMFVIYFSIVDVLLNKKTQLFLIIKSITLTLFPLILFGDFLFLTSGNFVLQSSILMITFLNLKKENKNILFLPSLGLMYFSSTALLISLPLWIGLFIYLLLTRRCIKNWYILIYILISISMSISTFTNISKYSPMIIPTLLFGATLLLIWVPLFFARNTQMQSIDYYNILSNKVFVLYYFIVFIILSISQFIFWSIIYKSIYYSAASGILGLVFNLIFIFIAIVKYYEDKKIKIEWLFFPIVLFLSFSESAIQKLIPSISNNASSWRLIYLTMGMGNMVDIFTNIIFLLSFGLSIKKASNLLNKSIFKKIFNISFTGSFTIASSLVFSNSYTDIFNKREYTQPKAIFSSNVTLNVNKVTNNDRRLLENLSDANWEKSFISDLPINEYIKKYVDVSSYLFGQNYNANGSYTLTYNGWLWAIIEQSANSGKKIEATDSMVKDMLNRLISNISNYNIKSVTNKKISSVNLIILNKQTSYYQVCDDFLISVGYSILKGENITIYEK